MKNTKTENSTPLAIKVFGGLMALLGLLFSFSSYFNPAQISPGAVLDNPSIQLAFYTVGAMSLGLSVGLALAILSNRPKSMALILIVRTVIALQDLAIAIILGLGGVLIGFQVIVSLFGIASIVKLFNIIQATDKHAA